MTTRKRRPVGQTLGGIIVGLDYQIFRVGKPPAEMVESAKPIAPVAASGGGTLDIDLPPLGERSADARDEAEEVREADESDEGLSAPT
jgi:hypothetical protein